MDPSSDQRNDGVQRAKPARRFYECSFCKRGFTNAQALGGHMNIHRRDRDPKFYSSTSSSNPPPPPPTKTHFSNSSAAASCASNLYSSPAPSVWQDSHQDPYVYFQAQGSHMVPHTPECSRSQGLLSSSVSEQQVIWGANLSLQVGDAAAAGSADELANDDDVDLELRLGHH